MDVTERRPVDPEIERIFSLFFDGKPVFADVLDTRDEDEDFRETVIVTAEDGSKFVLKLAANDFTFPEKIGMWARTIREYRALGYYCPLIISDKTGGFPVIGYRGRDCAVYAEEYSKYSSLEDRMAGENERQADRIRYYRDIWTMTARIAALKLDYTDYPSGYCLFKTFCPSEKIDEVLENALDWKAAAEALPDEFSAQAQRIWKLWRDNREALEPLYALLPTSVFQADLNSTNLLVDEEGRFMGVFDFNLCGKEVFINYLIREINDDFEEEIERIRQALRIARDHYTFSKEEKNAVLMLYRCLKPLWWTRVQDLIDAGNDREAIRRCLDSVEHYLTEDIDFRSCME